MKIEQPDCECEVWFLKPVQNPIPLLDKVSGKRDRSANTESADVVFRGESEGSIVNKAHEQRDLQGCYDPEKTRKMRNLDVHFPDKENKVNLHCR